MNKILEPIFSKIFEFFLFLPLISPFLVIPLGLAHFIVPKTLFFQVCVAIAFLLWLVILKTQHLLRYLQHPITIAALILLTVSMISSLTGVDSIQSFFSTQERMTGLLFSLYLFLWFFMLATTFSHQKWRLFFSISLCISIIVPFSTFILPQENQLGSILGNTISASVYSLIHVYLSLYLFTTSSKVSPIKLFTLLTFFVNVIYLFLLGSRGVIFAFGLSFLIYSLLIILLLKSKIIRRVGGMLMILSLIISLSLGLFGITQQGAQWAEHNLPYGLKRIILISTYWNPEDRTAAWNLGIKSVKENLFFGWGPENFSYAFQKKYSTPIPGEGRNSYDRAHNQYIDVFVTTGLVGLLVYCFFWIIIFSTLLKCFINHSKGGMLCLLFLIISYLLQNITAFDTNITLILMWAIIAHILSLNIFNTCQQVNLTNALSPIKKQILMLSKILITLFMVWTSWEFTIQFGIKSWQFTQGVQALELNNSARAQTFFDSVAHSPLIPTHELRHNAANQLLMHAEKLLNSERVNEFLEPALFYEKMNIEQFPRNTSYATYYAFLTSKLSNNNSSFEYIKIRSSLESVLKYAPERPDVLFSLMYHSAKNKDTEGAGQYLLRLQKHYNTKEWYYIKAIHAFLTGYDNEGVTLLTDSISIKNEKFKMSTLETLALLELMRSLPRSAITKELINYLNSEPIFTQDPQFYSLKIILLNRTGYLDEAERHWKKLMKMDATIGLSTNEYIAKEGMNN